MITINNKILFTLISFSFALTIVGAIGLITGNPALDTPLRIGVFLFILSGTYLIAKNGVFIRSDEYRFTRIGLAVFIIGLLMRLMHWSYSKEIMFLGYLSIPCIYLFHMIKHKRTTWREFFKLFLTLLIVLNRSLVMMHMPYSKEMIGLAILIVSILLIDVIKNKRISMNG